MGTLFILLLTISSTMGHLNAQRQIDPILVKYLNEDLPVNLCEVDHALLASTVLYDSLYHERLFGEIPREFLVKELASGGNHIQIIYEFPSEFEGNGYKQSMHIIKELTFVFGKPAGVEWLSDRINLNWSLKDLKLSLIHRELTDLGVVIVRVDLMNDRPLLVNK